MVKKKTVRVNDMGDKLLTLITDLGWEYQRMSRSGQEVFDEIHQLLVRLKKMKSIWRYNMESKSFTYFSHNTMKEELVNLNENQLNALREFYVERFVDNMETKDLVQYVTDDMFQYMESLPDNEVIEECLNYWDDSFEDVVEEIMEFEQCDFKKTLEDKKDDYLDSLSEGKEDLDYGSKVDALVDSMGVTVEEESTTHRRRDLDSL